MIMTTPSPSALEHFLHQRFSNLDNASFEIQIVCDNARVKNWRAPQESEMEGETSSRDEVAARKSFGDKGTGNSACRCCQLSGDHCKLRWSTDSPSDEASQEHAVQEAQRHIKHNRIQFDNKSKPTNSKLCSRGQRSLVLPTDDDLLLFVPPSGQTTRSRSSSSSPMPDYQAAFQSVQRQWRQNRLSHHHSADEALLCKRVPPARQPPAPPIRRESFDDRAQLSFSSDADLDDELEPSFLQELSVTP